MRKTSPLSWALAVLAVGVTLLLLWLFGGEPGPSAVEDRGPTANSQNSGL